MTLRDHLGLNIKELRRFRGLNQEAFAHEALIDRGYVGAIENSKNAATVDLIQRAAIALEVPAFVLLLPRRDKGGWLVDFVESGGGRLDRP